MSRASEWAKTQEERPTTFYIDEWSSAWVDTAAGQPVCILARTILRPEQALALAAWITATFGEGASA